MERPVIRLFGPLTVEVDGRRFGPSDLGGRKPRQILEILLLADGRPVAKEELAELVWERDPPRNVGATIETYVSVLRRTFGHERARDLIVTETEAYRLVRSAAVVDLDRFDELLARAGHADPRTRRSLLEDALALVRGEVLEDEPYAPWAEEARRRYGQRVLEVRLDAALAALADGDPRGALAHAGEVLARDPLEERAYRITMLARYAEGARHEALRAYERCREVLRDELGADPDPASEALHQAILRDAPVERLLEEALGQRATASVRPRTPALRGRAMRVLLVEDDPADARLITEALEAGSVPMEVDHVEDGAGALRRARQAESRPDLVLLDVGLPDRSGLEVLAELKEDRGLRMVPVVMLTSSAAEADVARSYELHANSYVTKPLDVDDFADVVRALEAFWPLTAAPRTPDTG
jgi:SARP family transcriptional regulator, regulator of embCAB operon